eukprot:UN18074
MKSLGIFGTMKDVNNNGTLVYKLAEILLPDGGPTENDLAVKKCLVGTSSTYDVNDDLDDDGSGCGNCGFEEVGSWSRCQVCKRHMCSECGLP